MHFYLFARIFRIFIDESKHISNQFFFSQRKFPTIPQENVNFVEFLAKMSISFNFSRKCQFRAFSMKQNMVKNGFLVQFEPYMIQSVCSCWIGLIRILTKKKNLFYTLEIRKIEKKNTQRTLKFLKSTYLAIDYDVLFTQKQMFD